MPIMAMTERSDARGAARILAITVKSCVDQTKDVERYKSSFRNMYHLLEAYKSHGFVPLRYQPSSKRGPESLNILPVADERIDDLRLALEEALEAVYGDKESGVTSVEKVLQSIAYPDRAAQTNGDERDRTSAFLERFIDGLHVR